MTATTILDVFEPPAGRVAHSAALVAMTGARDLLEDALVRLTGLKAKQRAELGTMSVYLMLDPRGTPARNAPFPPHAIPGLYELHPRDVAPALLHAKLGLFAFARTRTGAPTDIRLAVFTGNLTYTCAKHQLELVAVIDVALGQPGQARERADVAAAARFVESLIARRFHLPERDGSRTATARQCRRSRSGNSYSRAPTMRTNGTASPSGS